MLIFISITLGALIIIIGSFMFGHDADHDHDLGGDNEPTVSVFSPKVIATLLMGFGAAGSVAEYYRPDHVRSSLIGLLCGIVLAAITYLMLGFLYKQQSSSLVNTNSAVGCTGTVTVSIAEAGLGEVGVQVEGLYCSYVARSKDGRPIPKGQTVRIVQCLGSQLLVEKE